MTSRKVYSERHVVVLACWGTNPTEYRIMFIVINVHGKFPEEYLAFGCSSSVGPRETEAGTSEGKKGNRFHVVSLYDTCMKKIHGFQTNGKIDNIFFKYKQLI